MLMRTHARAAVGRHARSERGAAAVEFAIVGSVMMLLLFGILDTGMFINANSVVANAVRDGARSASLGATDATARSKVTSGVKGVPGYAAANLTAISIVCTNPAGGTASCTDSGLHGGSVVVTATYQYHWLTPFGLGTSNIVKRSEMIIE